MTRNKRFTKLMALFITLVMVTALIPFSPAVAEDTDGALTYELFEDFTDVTTTNGLAPWTVTGHGWQIRPDENDRMHTSLTGSQTIANGYATFNVGAATNSIRAYLKQPVKSDYRINVTFDWYPNSNNAILGLKDSSTLDMSSQEYWTKYVTFCALGGNTYYRIGSLMGEEVENIAPPNYHSNTYQNTNHGMRVGLPGVTLIKSGIAEWYTISIDIDFVTNTLDLLITNQAGTTVHVDVKDQPFLNTPGWYKGTNNQYNIQDVADGTVRGFKFGAVAGAANGQRVDNVHLSAYSAYAGPVISNITDPNPRTGQFGMTIADYVTPASPDTLVFNVYTKNTATGEEALAGTVNAPGTYNFTAPRGNGEYIVTAEAFATDSTTPFSPIVGVRGNELPLVMFEEGLLPPAAGVTAANIVQANGSTALSWDPVLGDDPAVDRYAVYRAFYEIGPWELAGYADGITTFTDVNPELKAFVMAYYRIQALSPGGAAPMSPVLSSSVGVVPQWTPEGKNRALSAVYLGGLKGAETMVTASGPNGEPLTDGVYLSWRWFGADDALNTTFTVERNDGGNWITLVSGVKLTNLVDPAGTDYSKYRVIGTGDAAQGINVIETVPWENFYLPLRIFQPPPQYITHGTLSAGSTTYYDPHESLLGDLDGDGQLDIVVKWMPRNNQDSGGGANIHTGNTIIDGYKVNWQTGETRMLWRLDLGQQIRSGKHYAQFGVEDFAGVGYAQVMTYANRGTTSYRSLDGTDETLVKTSWITSETPGDPPLNNGASSFSHIIAVDGKTGEIIGAAAPPSTFVSTQRGRENATVAWIDGHHNNPTFVIGKQYNMNNAHPQVLRLTNTPSNSPTGSFPATFNMTLTMQASLSTTGGFGNHQMTALDLNGDGYDDLVLGGAVFLTEIQPDGTGRPRFNTIASSARIPVPGGTHYYGTGNIPHGDAMHISNWVSDEILWSLIQQRPDLAPEITSLEALKAQTNGKPRQYQMQVSEGGAAILAAYVKDLLTGIVVAGYTCSSGDVGRGMGADVDPTWRGAEFWGSKEYNTTAGNWDTRYGGMYSTEFPGVRSNTAARRWGYWATDFTNQFNHRQAALMSGSMNFSIFWDGDLLKELQDHAFEEARGYAPINTNITKWDYLQQREIILFETTEATIDATTKGTPNYLADFLGDWREEIILVEMHDSNMLRVYQTTIQTDYVLPWLMEDMQYRSGVLAHQSVYNQPANPSFLPSNGVVTTRNLQAFTNRQGFVEVSYEAANDGDLFGFGTAGHQLWRKAGTSGIPAPTVIRDQVFMPNFEYLNRDGKTSFLTPKGTLSNTTRLGLIEMGYEPVTEVDGSQNIVDRDVETGQYSYIVVGMSEDGKLSYLGKPSTFNVENTATMVTYLDEEGNVLFVDYIAQGTPIEPLVLTKFGYTLSWLLDGVAFDFSTPIMEETTFVINWTLNPINWLRIGEPVEDDLPVPAAPMIQIGRNSSIDLVALLEPDTLPVGIVWTVNNPNLATIEFDDNGNATVFTKGMSGNLTVILRAPTGVTHNIILRII